MKCIQFPILLFCVIILSLVNASAVGIGYRYVVTGGPLDFQPEMEKTFNYELITNAGSTMDYEISVKGGLEQYVTLSTNLIKDVRSGTLVPFSAHLKLPSKLESGIHEARICVLETQARGGGGGMIGVRTEACGGFTIRVLYEGKYLKIERFDVPSVNIGERVNIEVGVKSWSTVDINSIKGIIDIFSLSRENKEMKRIATVMTDERQLKSNAEEVLVANFDTAGLEAGKYTAFLALYYDGEQINSSREFRIGDLSLKIINYTREFEKGKVNKFEVDVLSQWNSKINNVYSTIDIDGERLTTPVADFDSWENRALVTYWDATNKKVGDYNGKIVVYYSNKTTEEDVKLKVIVGKKEWRGIITNILGIALIIILIIILIIMIWKTRKKDKAAKRNK